MTDIVLQARLEIDDTKKNKKTTSEFSDWLNKEYIKYGKEFMENILRAANLPLEGYMMLKLDFSERYDPYLDLRHPTLGKDGKWLLDDIKLQNKLVIWIRLENQWIKGKVVVEKKNSHIVIEPEGVNIPINAGLFLQW